MADAAFDVLKVTVIVLVSAVFLSVILALLNFIQVVVFGNVISEFFNLISMYLPFDASSVFGSVGVVLVAILSFMVGKKIFDLTSWSISAT